MKRRSLIFRLLVLSAAAVTLPALVISLMQRSISSHALQDSIQQQQTELARRIAEEVDGQIRHAQGLLALVAHSSFFSAGSRVDQYEALRNLVQEAPAFQEAMLVNDDGQELMKLSQQTDHPRLLQRGGNLKKPFIGSPFFSANRAPTILLGEPLRAFANPTRTGAVLAKLSFTTLGTLMQQASESAHGTAFIVDDRGDLLAHPDGSRVLAHTNLAKLPVVMNWLSRPAGPTQLVEYRTGRSAPVVAVAYPIPLLKSAVVVEQPSADVYAPLRRMRNEFILWTLVWVSVFIAIAVAIAWRILQPLRQLRAAAEQIGRGRTNVRLHIQTRDELEELGAAFEKMAGNLAELERMRSDLINMVVHDLKMPLSTILPSLDCLIAGDLGALPSGQLHFIQMARRSAQEMLMLIQNLLDVAKMEEGKLSLHPEPFLAVEWAGSVVSTFRPLAQAGAKELELVVSGGLAPIDGDISLLSRVLGNLISNALRHTAAGTGEVAVTLYREGSQLAVQVRDNGEGIPAEEQERIFERFVQGSGQKTALRSGTGLGLTFCKMVIEAHGGRIGVYSQPQEGSLFTFHLPMRDAPPAAAAETIGDPLFLAQPH